MPFQFRKEAIEEDLNTNFPSQGQGNPPLYYSLSEVVVPTYSINNVAEGSPLGVDLQTAWDFSTGANQIANTTTTVINQTGFWLVDVQLAASGGTFDTARGRINDGTSTKNIWAATTPSGTGTVAIEQKFVVFLRSGDSLEFVSPAATIVIDVWYRQIADVNGNLVNPLGYSAA
jgi:hypothetical protein